MTISLRPFDMKTRESHSIHLDDSKIPILISIPHSGLFIPQEVEKLIEDDQLAAKDDTDFDVDLLYSFAKDLGLSTIKANYNRWFIDLNRQKEDQALYNDGRNTTSLFPTKDFYQRNIYKDPAHQISRSEMKIRLNKVYKPYYNQITDILHSFVNEHGVAILWDAHSIRRQVSSIQQTPFKDLILGTNDHLSASQEIIHCVEHCILKSRFSYSLNSPFKGGNITRHFGQPKNKIHALQLEMSKDCYLNTDQKYDSQKARPMIELLSEIFESLIKLIS